MKRLAVAAALVLAVAAGALLILGRGGPPLEPWHTEDLELEFTAQRADRVRSFDDYLRLEDAVFAELEEKIYAVTGSGPAYALDRYSTGSAADPQDWSPNWNRSFELPADNPVGGVLMLHGMSDSPYSLRALGEALNARGYWVLGPRLPGHGTVPSGLKSVAWRDMAAVARLAVDHLADRAGGKPIHIVGYSTGAALALDLALDAQEDSTVPRPASLVLISPAIGVHPLAALAVWKARLSALPGLEGLAWLDVQPEFDPFKYNSFATNAGAQVFSLTRAVAARLAGRAKAKPSEVLPPTLVFKSTVDATVSTNAVVDGLLARLAPNRHELVLFDINQFAAKSKLLISDPAPLTDRLLADTALPFTLTLVTNEAPASARVLARRKPPSSATMSSEPLGLRWPNGVISLSHVALPFPPDDPLYGARPPGKRDVIFLGQMAIRGERGLLRIPSDWLMRLRHNPFHSYLEDRALSWIDGAGD
jgi:alpha-beta hydrolase superfamily lysophospholipase